MAVNYPTTLDDDTTLFLVNEDQTISEVHHNTLKDAIIALETELGILPKGSDSDVVARLNRLDTVLHSGGFEEFDEILDPVAPAVDKARLYVRDNGSGKTQLVVRFPTGAIQVIATEP